MRSSKSDQLISVTLASAERVRRREIALLAAYDRSDLRPCRKPGVHRTQKHIPGYFWISQLNELMWYESRLEMFSLKQLDFTQKITAILPQPFVLHYHADEKKRTHTPDYLLWLEGNQRLLVNVKPRKYLDKPLNQRSFNACKQLAESLGWGYQTMSEPNPIFLANLNWLAGYRRIPADFSKYATLLIEKAVRRQTIQELLTDLGPESLVRPVLFFLMWKKQLEFDVQTLLSNNSEVWLAA
jgi:hypothetical protein